MSKTQRIKLSATQANLLLHFYNGEGHVKAVFGRGFTFYSADGSQEFTVREDTVTKLYNEGLLTCSFRHPEFDRYRISKSGCTIAATL